RRVARRARSPSTPEPGSPERPPARSRVAERARWQHESPVVSTRRILSAMRCHVTLAREGGEFVARCAEVPGGSGRGASRQVAVARLRDNVRFWLEACPCDTTADGGLVLEVIREAG